MKPAAGAVGGVVWMAVWLCLARPALADAPRSRQLTARHLALLYNRRSEASKQLADYYATARGIPPHRMLGIDVPVAETLPRYTYERTVLPAVRRALQNQWKDEPIRCFVTFYDLPIRIGNSRPSPKERRLAAKAKTVYDKTAGEFDALITRIEALAGDETRSPNTRPANRHDSLVARFQRYEAAKLSAYQRIAKLDPSRQPPAKQMLLKLIETAEGAAAMISMLRVMPQANRKDLQRVERLRVRTAAMQEEIKHLLASGIADPQRPVAWEKVKAFRGLGGLLSMLDHDRHTLLGDETQASFDSELSLVSWDDYPLYRWVMNLFNARLSRNPQLRASIPPDHWNAPLYMVARLDGASVEIVKRMIDDAVAVEKTGLTGHVYLDARGYGQEDGYLVYDQSLIQLADLLGERTKLRVTLDQREELFGPGQCPNTALYAGWYSHRKYVDAFDFVKGAVAYHLASSEAVSLRDPSKQYWCKSLLADGVAATMGPVHEPYLSAFPLPRDFCGLLLTGRYSLVECYYYTKNFNSWMMLLLGDPLYRPFAVNPQLAVEDVFEPQLLPLANLTEPHPNSRP